MVLQSVHLNGCESESGRLLLPAGFCVRGSFDPRTGRRFEMVRREPGRPLNPYPRNLSPGGFIKAAAAPHMAWSSAEGRVIEDKLIGHLVKYDDAIHPVVVDGRVFFGSSVDHHLHCLDLATGREIWTFGTGGPIRLAPSVDQQRVYFGLDDGFAYCLSADTGTMIWRVSASPSNEYLLARGVDDFRWPAHQCSGGFRKIIAYFGSGIFPHENIYLFAVNAADGTVV